jgi:hypothetical protein
MNHVEIDAKKVLKKWAPIVESLNANDSLVKESADKKAWMSEYAEYHQIYENQAYANQTISGMGSVVSPQPGTIPGAAYTGNGTAGSGDYGQQLLAVSMKVAAQTIGLDLVPVKPTPGPVIDLMYVDYRYDDIEDGEDEKPQVFKVSLDNTDLATLKAYLDDILTVKGVTQNQGGLNGRIWVPLGTDLAPIGVVPVATSEPTGSKEGVLEFLGYSRIDGFPMFRAYRQANTASASAGIPGGTAGWSFNQDKNTFPSNQTIKSIIDGGFSGHLDADVAAGAGAGAAETGALNSTIVLVSAMEDQIPGFVSNWNKSHPMERGEDDSHYPGVIGPNVSTKRVTVGTIEISSALKRTEIEDIKAQTGMDIVQKLESVLVNELSQTISRQIVDKLFEMGDLNRNSAPVVGGGGTIFDLDTSYVTGGPGGETTHAVQRKLISKMMSASHYIASEGRIGPAQFAVTNGRLAAALADVSGYTVNTVNANVAGKGQLYPVGTLNGIQVYVDPYMKYDDDRILIGRRNQVDQPGIVFIPYLMAQSISLISEATRAPRLFLRSRYAITEVGFFPQKQYMTIQVTDADNYLA